MMMSWELDKKKIGDYDGSINFDIVGSLGFFLASMLNGKSTD